MYISKFRIVNYKSYKDSGEIELKPGFNILTGQNSGGKTALLEALTLQFTSTPHISDATVPYRGAPPDPVSLARVTFTLAGTELIAMFRGLPANAPRWLPEPTQRTTLPSGADVDASAAGMNRILSELAGRPEVPVRLQYESRSPGAGGGWTIADEDNVFGLYRTYLTPGNSQRRYYPLQLDQEGNIVVAAAGPTFTNSGNDLRAQLATMLLARIYRFRAERFVFGESKFGNNPALAGDASNLPEVLNVLDGNTARFQRLNGLMREILPQVKHISVRPIDTQTVQVLVWPVDYSTEKDYLAIPLNKCGSGVARSTRP